MASHTNASCAYIVAITSIHLFHWVSGNSRICIASYSFQLRCVPSTQLIDFAMRFLCESNMLAYSAASLHYAIDQRCISLYTHYRVLGRLDHLPAVSSLHKLPMSASEYLNRRMYGSIAVQYINREQRVPQE